MQIGTYEKFADKTKQAVKGFDDVHVFTYKNISRVTVGEFTSKDSAKTLLRDLKKVGFKDAFIRRTGYVDLNETHSTIEKFNILISEFDAKAFYLDGDMFIFQGKGYIKIHHQNLEKISRAKPEINLNPNNNFQLLNSY
ncbi:MAG: SPOR domain-containing protein [Gammaproteobacteria bacterium]